MILPDVNVLVHAHREGAPDHAKYRAWLEGVLSSPQAYGMSESVLSGFVRVVTHPRVFVAPTPLVDALGFAQQLRGQPQCVPVTPGPRHWELFAGLCERVGARGNVVPDAYHAALAIESGCEWLTADSGFARFPGLRWRHPLRAG